MYIYINVSTQKVFRSHCITIKTDSDPTTHEHELIRGLLVRLFNRDMSSRVLVSPSEFNVDISKLDRESDLTDILSCLRDISKLLIDTGTTETSIIVYILHLSLRRLLCTREDTLLSISIPPEAVVVVLERLRSHPVAIRGVDCEDSEEVEYSVGDRSVKLPVLINICQEGPLDPNMDKIMRSLIANSTDRVTMLLVRYHIRMVTGCVPDCSMRAFSYILKGLNSDLDTMTLDTELVKSSLRLAIRELMGGNEQE